MFYCIHLFITLTKLTGHFIFLTGNLVIFVSFLSLSIVFRCCSLFCCCCLALFFAQQTRSWLVFYFVLFALWSSWCPANYLSFYLGCCCHLDNVGMSGRPMPTTGSYRLWTRQVHNYTDCHDRRKGVGQTRHDHLSVVMLDLAPSLTLPFACCRPIAV